MTIGVASYGSNAGAAVNAALIGAELLGRGAIGGFAVFAILDADGMVHHRSVQDGGVTALDLPDAWLAAECAAAISSGPNRPEPLVEFLPGRDGCGLITGHRLPNSACAEGRPANLAVLDLLAEGEAPQAAIDAILLRQPEIDAGLIALTGDGTIGHANSERVTRRGDLGTASRSDGKRGFALLHNSIFTQSGPCQSLADALAGFCWNALTGAPAAHEILRLEKTVRLATAEQDRVHVDRAGRIVALEVADANLLNARRKGTAVYLGTEIWRENERVGFAAGELVAGLADGTAHPLPSPFSNRMMVRLGDVAS